MRKMKIFKGNMEIGLTEEDVRQIMQEAVNGVLWPTMHKHEVERVSFHPGRKYVVRVTVAPGEQE